MIFKFQHEGKIYPFDDEELSLDEARFIRDQGGFKSADLFLKFRELDVDAVLTVFALALKRGGMVIDKLDDVPLDPKRGYVQLITSLVNDEDDEVVATPKPARKSVRRKAVTKS